MVQVARIGASTYGGGPITVAQAIGITSISRQAGSDAGGVSVTLTVTNASGSPTVQFGSTSATNVVVVNATTITCTVPALSGGAVSTGTPVNVSIVGGGTLTNGFTYFPAATTTYTSHDFEDNTLGAFTGTNTANGTVAASAEQAYAGTRSAKCSVIGNFADGGARLEYTFSGAIKNPALDEANGIYFRWYQYIPASVVSHVSTNSRQIKVHLFRKTAGSGQPGWIMAGIGSDFGDDDFTCFVDNGVISISGGATNIPFGDGVWVEIILWQKRSSTTGRARCWVNGREQFDVTHADMGNNTSTDEYVAYFGITYSESAAGITSYIDNIKICNGFPDP